MMDADVLWGGTLLQVSFDVPGECISLTVSVLDNGITTEYLVVCTDVIEFCYVNGLPEKWNYAEVTEAHSNFDPVAGLWQFEALLWSDDAGIMIRCRQMSIESVKVT